MELTPSSAVPYLVLVVDDDPVVTGLLVEDLPAHGFEVLSCGACQEAARLLESKPVRAVLLDYNLPDGSGADFFRKMREKHAHIPVIFITSFPDVQQAVGLMKEGAADYFIKPFVVTEVARRLGQLIETHRLHAETVRQTQRPFVSGAGHELVGGSAAMEKVRQIVMDVAKAPQTPVLINGETGTGKEVVAWLIHQNTWGDTQPWVEVDCATIPKPLFESELFGHEKGAFTGADRVKEGLLELCKEGTVFFDEIGELDIDVQSRLLRVLETHQFRRVGGTKALSFGARVIAATNRNLEELLQTGKFRSDLYFRLAVYKIQLPALRHHREDIGAIAGYFLKDACVRHGKPGRRLAPSFFKKLETHSFPGNVRELRNLVEQAVIQGVGEEVDFQGPLVQMPGKSASSIIPPPAPSASGAKTLSEHERQVIEAALQKQGGNRAAAARQLGISRPALLRRLMKLKGET
ncbi:MAG: sigma-54 dependent transcriptional regulator [Verrucomicrobiae bacterium]|nr:sigma-54 dependent transcriptional regulator [Verrucomicrobiae bacterium]